MFFKIGQSPGLCTVAKQLQGVSAVPGVVSIITYVIILATPGQHIPSIAMSKLHVRLLLVGRWDL
jgi:hypothetical protein